MSQPPLRTGRAAFTASGSAPAVLLHGHSTMKRSFAFLQHPRSIHRGQLARSLGTFAPVFPQARGLRHGSSSPCARLSRPPTTLPHPTLREGVGVSLGSPFPPSHSP